MNKYVEALCVSLRAGVEIHLAVVAAHPRRALPALLLRLGRLQTRKGSGRHCEAKPKQSMPPPLAAAFSLAPI